MQTDEGEQYASLACEYQDAIGTIERVPEGYLLILGYGEGVETFRTATDLLKYLLHDPKAKAASAT